MGRYRSPDTSLPLRYLPTPQCHVKPGICQGSVPGKFLILQQIIVPSSGEMSREDHDLFAELRAKKEFMSVTRDLCVFTHEGRDGRAKDGDLRSVKKTCHKVIFRSDKGAGQPQSHKLVRFTPSKIEQCISVFTAASTGQCRIIIFRNMSLIRGVVGQVIGRICNV